MKLSAMSIDLWGARENVAWNQIGLGFNLVYGKPGSGKTALAQFIRQVFFGHWNNDQVNNGFLDMTIDGKGVRLSRPAKFHHQLQMVDLTANGSLPGERSSTARALQEIGPNGFDLAFFIDFPSSSLNTPNLVDFLRHTLGIPIKGNHCSQEQKTLEASRMSLQRRFDDLSNQIVTLEDERQQLTRQIEIEQENQRSRQFHLDSQIADLDRRLDQTQLTTMRREIDSLDREIADLRLQMESVSERVEYVSRPFRPSEGLAILYRRLDEIDAQIMRWRRIHTDIQEQRISLKDEMQAWSQMTVDSTSHPYHRSRELLQGIENQIGQMETSITNWQAGVVTEPHRSQLATQLTTLCGQMRADLYALCDELGTQFKQVRHRTAAAELKRLRRCYHEIGDNLEALIENRRLILQEIGQIDPAGAAAIQRNDIDFCSCAQHEGYWQARRRLLGEPETTDNRIEFKRPDLAAETRQLQELQRVRADSVRQLVNLENQFSGWMAQRDALLAERERSRTNSTIGNTQARLQQFTADWTAATNERRRIATELDELASRSPVPMDATLGFASHMLQRLTRARLQEIRLINSGSLQEAAALEVEDQRGYKTLYHLLGIEEQQLVTLAVRLAIVDNFRRQGHQLPMIIDDLLPAFDSITAETVLSVLVDFANEGNQIILLTSDPNLRDLAKRRNCPIFDLPETSVTPVLPLWSPERVPDAIPREPEFLTPFTTRRPASSNVVARQYPQVKYPQIGQFIDHSVEHFDRDLGEQPLPDCQPLRFKQDRWDDVSSLKLVGIFDSSQLDRLNRVGIYCVRQLLERSPHDHRTNAIVCESELDYWQSLVWLMLCIPELTIQDAQLLNGLGISEPEQLEDTHSQQLQDRIARFLTTAEGRRFASLSGRYHRQTFSRWYDSMGKTRSGWRVPGGYSRRKNWRSSFSPSVPIDPRIREQRPDDRYEPLQPRRSGDRSPVREIRRMDRPTGKNDVPVVNRSEPSISTPNGSSNPPPLRFYLELTDPLEAAPTIGPKTAERFTQIGVHTVADFLKQTAESMAAKIKYKRITVDLIRQWQHQARLVCRVPNLRGHDAQLLVACGITEAEDLAHQSADRLLSLIQPFAQSKEGLKIIRGGTQPDLEEVTHWIRCAQQTRSLQAA